MMMEGSTVIYGFDMLYRILDKYIENSMDETEHAFIASIKWENSYCLGDCSREFWEEIQDTYGICLSECDIQCVANVGDLKKMICYLAG